MDGFKNSTKTKYVSDGPCKGYAKGGSVKGEAKMAKVMGEFAAGKLHSGSKKGPEVKNPKQAVAIAMSEARKAGAKMPVQKKSLGGILKAISPAAAMLSGQPEKFLGGMSTVGLLSQLMKKKQSGQPLTPAEDKQLAQSAQTPMKKGGMAKKGVPVAPKGPLVGLAAMPKKK